MPTTLPANSSSLSLANVWPAAETAAITLAFSFAASGVGNVLVSLGLFTGEPGAVAALSLFFAACFLLGFWIRRRIATNGSDAVIGVASGVGVSFVLRSIAQNAPPDVQLLLLLAATNAATIVAGYLFADRRHHSRSRGDG